LALLRRGDRNWVLSQLPTDQRQELNAILVPLLSLGARRLSGLEPDIEALLAAGPMETEPATKDPQPAVAPDPSPRRLDRVSADELRPILRELPIECVGLIGGQMPATRKHVMTAVQRPFERDIPVERFAQRDVGVSEAFVEAMMEVLEQRLQSERVVGEQRRIVDAGGRP